MTISINPKSWPKIAKNGFNSEKPPGSASSPIVGFE
jgi:hypothetical protein